MNDKNPGREELVLEPLLQLAQDGQGGAARPYPDIIIQT